VALDFVAVLASQASVCGDRCVGMRNRMSIHLEQHASLQTDWKYLADVVLHVRVNEM